MNDFGIDFRKIWRLLSEEQWWDPSYSTGKAYVTACFAKIAYLHIPDMELDDAGRAKFIPCYENERMRGLRQKYDVLEFLSRGDFGDVFIIETEYSVSVITRAYNLLIIATRGTKTLNDAWVDVKARNKKFTVNGTTYSFHRGFLQLARDLWEEIVETLIEKNLLTRDVPIYFAGHSLGGALSANMRMLMAASELADGQTYIFGTPKYCDAGVLRDFETPKAVINPRDLVPKVPPWLANYPVAQVIPPYAKGFPLRLKRVLQHHSMEHYLTEIDRLLPP